MILVPIVACILLIGTYALGLHADDEFWSDAFALPTLFFLALGEMVSIDLGVRLGRRVLS